MAVLVDSYSFEYLYSEGFTINSLDVEFDSNKLRCKLRSDGHIFLCGGFGGHIFFDRRYDHSDYQYCFVFNCPIKQQHTLFEPETSVKKQIDDLIPINKHNRIYILQNRITCTQFGLIVDMHDTLFVFKIGSKLCMHVSRYCRNRNHRCEICEQCCNKKCYGLLCSCNGIHRSHHIDFNTMQYANLYSLADSSRKYNIKHEICGENIVGILLSLTTIMTIDSNTSIITNVGVLKPTGHTKVIRGDDGDELCCMHMLYYNLIENHNITNYSNLFEYSKKVKNEDELKIKSVSWIKLNLSDNKEFMLRQDPECWLYIQEIEFPYKITESLCLETKWMHKN
jgi:hypothetical protein